jgi:hypothetical protein
MPHHAFKTSYPHGMMSGDYKPRFVHSPLDSSAKAFLGQILSSPCVAKTRVNQGDSRGVLVMLHPLYLNTEREISGKPRAA